MTAEPRVDGRTARRDRNTEAVLEAVRALFLEGNYGPTAEQVAARSGVSLRSVYRYFEDTDALLRAALARAVARAEPLFAIEDLGQGPLHLRIERIIEQRLLLYRTSGTEARAALSLAHGAPMVAEQLERRRQQLSVQVRDQFAPELKAAGVARGRALAACADVLLQFDALDHLIGHCAMTERQCRRVLAEGLMRLLADYAAA